MGVRRRRVAGFLAAVSAMLLTAGLAAAAGTCFETKRIAAMRGAFETPPADLQATGTAVIGLDLSEGLICWSVTVRRLGSEATGAHIHKAPSGTPGPVVVNIPVPTSGNTKACASAPRELIRDILRRPAQYYVNVHTKQFPGGAIRGQLR